MGKLILFAVVLAAGAVGYLLWSTKPEAPPQPTQPGYVQGLQLSEQHAEAAAAGANLDNVRSALEKYRSLKGSNPASLQDLVPDFLDHVPGGLQYDPATGTVSAAP
ncbi:MAG TPA: hypothetical protein VFR02_06505 [bacterium]|nr:hypothetical protein [bacterium]